MAGPCGISRAHKHIRPAAASNSTGLKTLVMATARNSPVAVQYGQ